MSRSPLVVAGLVWAAAVAAVVIMAVFHVDGIAHGYYAAWLVAISLPLGALPLLMILDLLGIDDEPTASLLRLLVAGLPVLAILMVPALLDLGALYPWVGGSTLSSDQAGHLKGFAEHWFAVGPFRIRSIVYLVLWLVLSLFFIRPSVPSAKHSVAAGFGLALHLLIGTLAAYDWFMSLDQAFTSSAYGLIVITAQCGFALTVAVLAGLLVGGRPAPGRLAVVALLTVAFVAAFAQFSQFLVIWSANLPKEIVWYQTRWRGLLGPVFAIGAPILLALATVCLMPTMFNRRRLLIAVGLVALLIVDVIDLVCLASPRDTFQVVSTLIAVVFLVAIVGIAAGCAALVGDRQAVGVRHG